MAIYHCNIEVVSRDGGHSSVAGAAYISRSCLLDERTGEVHDFRNAHDHEAIVADLGVNLPESAPARWRIADTDRDSTRDTRERFWNEVERVEKGPKAQLCRRIECALPDELSETDQVVLAREIVAGFTAQGMVVDACVHRNREDGSNCHLHMLMPLRACDENGFRAKSEKVYLVRDASGKEANLSARELKEALASNPGWEKVYRYRRGNERRELTPSEARAWDGCKRSSKSPVSATRYLVDWNDKSKAEEWRRLVADRVNAALERAGKTDRVDHRSYERQGIDRIPTLHEGSRVHAAERRAAEAAREAHVPYEPVTDRRRENVERSTLNGYIERANQAMRSVNVQVRAARDRALETARRWRAGFALARSDLRRALEGRDRGGDAVRRVLHDQEWRRAMAKAVVAPARRRAMERMREAAPCRECEPHRSMVRDRNPDRGMSR